MAVSLAVAARAMAEAVVFMSVFGDGSGGVTARSSGGGSVGGSGRSSESVSLSGCQLQKQ